ncbi:MAG: MarR family transcriptional regulator [Agromyces sp.]|nr:MarR family transcriptional regulator [Agromyces sp.]
MMRQMQREHAELSTELLGAVAPADRAAFERGVEAIAAHLRELVEAEQARGADSREASA